MQDRLRWFADLPAYRPAWTRPCVSVSGGDPASLQCCLAGVDLVGCASLGEREFDQVVEPERVRPTNPALNP